MWLESWGLGGTINKINLIAETQVAGVAFISLFLDCNFAVFSYYCRKSDGARVGVGGGYC